MPKVESWGNVDVQREPRHKNQNDQRQIALEICQDSKSCFGFQFKANDESLLLICRTSRKT